MPERGLGTLPFVAPVAEAAWLADLSARTRILSFFRNRAETSELAIDMTAKGLIEIIPD